MNGKDLIRIIYFDVFKDKVFKIMVILFLETTAKCSISFIMGNIIGHIVTKDL